MMISKRALIVVASVALVGLAGCKKIDSNQGNTDKAAVQAQAVANVFNIEGVGAVPVKGNPNAMITILEFSDYQCPFCSKVEPTIKQILDAYPNDVRVAFVHNPLDFHQLALPAAKAAVAAQKQGKFWEMHEALFANQKGLSEDLYKAKAKELGLDEARFVADMNSPETDKFIKDGMKYGADHGIKGTPGFLINGVIFSGAQPFDNFKKAIDAELERAKKVAAEKKLSGDALYNELLASAPKPAAEPPKPAPKPAEPEPEPPARTHVDLADAPMLGNPDAIVTLVEFTDFQCPFCSRANTTIHQLLEKNPDKVRIVFRHYPLPFHDKAKLAHQAAEAAKIQGKFWEYYDSLFADQGKLAREDLIARAQTLGLDVAKFTADMDSEAVIKKVEADFEAGGKAGVRGTPHFFINGALFSGAQPLEAFQANLDKEYNMALTYQEKGLKGNDLYEQIIKDNIPAPLVVDIEGSPFKGAADAPVVIVQFSDFQCPFCSRVEPTIDALMADPAYAGKIKVVFKQMPLGFHDKAQKAAEAALFAADNGKFWELHKAMFANQNALTVDDIKKYAGEIGLDVAALDAALTSNKYAEAVAKDIKAANSVGISGTPSFVVNGKLVVGALPVEMFKKEIDAALANIAKAAGAADAAAPAADAAAPAPAADAAAPAPAADAAAAAPAADAAAPAAPAAAAAPAAN